ncbi:Glycerophosphoryl diester phosphodiesterase [Thalassolituus maritimus]|uniref:Glycerophosphoryl diester phosphodiesterase n=1 Tax=Thalassolituus maritimus TaxID=484498 RepID=A0A1N7NJL4_9GAMM|nr:glycerophosphodiester phosphodiesterase family protein [Thalassolituus maritimus]SIS98471.1 Glycerophosphoryl diester phosphodiesterase [Thalassolituus maritimus]
MTVRNKVITKYAPILPRAKALPVTVLLGWLSLILAGCSSSPVKPLDSEVASLNSRLYLAHGASAGDAPLNSLQAIEATLKRSDYDGIEIDIVLAGDSVPLLAHDPWISEQNCRRYDGQAFEPVYIRDVYSDELNELFECHFPAGKNGAAEKTSDYHPLVTLAEAFSIIRGYPEKTIYLDLKIQAGATLDVEEYGAEIYLALIEQEIENPVFIEVPEKYQVEKIKNSLEDFNARIALSYSAFYAGDDWDYIGALAAVRTLFFAENPIAAANESGADVLVSPTIVMSHSSVENLHKSEILYGTFLVDDAESLKSACDHGADIIITDIPIKQRCEPDL